MVLGQMNRWDLQICSEDINALAARCRPPLHVSHQLVNLKPAIAQDSIALHRARDSTHTWSICDSAPLTAAT